MKVTGAEDLLKVSRNLKTHGSPAAIRRELTKGLRVATRPAVREVKSAALALPSHGTSHSGLRRRTANATGANIRTSGINVGVRVRVSAGPLGTARRVPQLMNRGAFRHPVFGNRRVWVTQRGQRGWFDRANRAQESTVRAECVRVINAIERKLAGK